MAFQPLLVPNPTKMVVLKLRRAQESSEGVVKNSNPWPRLQSLNLHAGVWLRDLKLIPSGLARSQLLSWKQLLTLCLGGLLDLSFVLAFLGRRGTLIGSRLKRAVDGHCFSISQFLGLIKLFGLGSLLLEIYLSFFCLFFSKLLTVKRLSSRFSVLLKTSFSGLALLASPFPVALPNRETKKVFKTHQGIVSLFISSKSMY